MTNEAPVIDLTDDERYELSLRKRRVPPYWWPDTQSVLQLFLTAAIVWMVGFILMQLFSGGEVKIDPSARDLVMVIIGIILGAFKDVFGFTFGSSAAEKQKGDAINRSIESKDKIIARGVETTAVAAAAASEALRSPSSEALRAAAIVAPAAARVEAPPAAEDAAPAAAEKAVADAMAKIEGAWWDSKLSEEERIAIAAAGSDPQVMSFITAANTGDATPEHLEYLVTKGLLTQARADEIKVKTPKETP